MTVQVLLSCMHQKDTSIISRSNIQSDIVVVNQCEYNERKEFYFKNKNDKECKAIFISTTERGLSRSRNMALKNATGDICLICDDDEILSDDYVEKIKTSYAQDPEATMIAFQIRDSDKNFPNTKKNINFLSALQLASWQLTFKRSDIIRKKILFDESLGSGVSKAGGEENMFVYDCLKNKLKVTYIPIEIGRMIEGASQWFHGVTPEFMFDKGVLANKLMGRIYGGLYVSYYLISKYHWYRKDISFLNACKSSFSGLFKTLK